MVIEKFDGGFVSRFDGAIFCWDEDLMRLRRDFLYWAWSDRGCSPCGVIDWDLFDNTMILGSRSEEIEKKSSGFLTLSLLL